MSAHIDIEELAMFAMLPVGAAEMQPVAPHLAECAVCRAELQRVRADLACYALTTEPVPLPTGARDRFIRRMQATSPAAQAAPARGTAPVPAPVPVERKRSFAGTVLPWVGWAVAAAALVVAFGLRQERDTLRGVVHTAQTQAARLQARSAAAQPAAGQPGLAAAQAAQLQARAAGAEAQAAGAEARLATLQSRLARLQAQTEQSRTQLALATTQLAQAQASAAGAQTQLAKMQAQAEQATRILDGLRDPHAVRVSLMEPKAPALPSARATYDQADGALLLQAGNLAPLPDNKVYELWVIPANGASPIPAGIFTPDAQGNATLLASKLPAGVKAKAFGITVEHAGGSAVPTMPIVLAGSPG